MKPRDVAAAIGLAPGTVSPALDGHRDAGPDQRAKAQAGADWLGWRLRTWRGETLGLLPPPPRGRSSNPFFADRLARIGGALTGTPVTKAATAVYGAADEMARRARPGRRPDAVIGCDSDPICAMLGPPLEELRAA